MRSLHSPSIGSGPPSRLRRAWRVVGYGLVVAVIVLSLAPVALELPVEQGDKFGHTLAYATMMGWFAQLHRTGRERLSLALGFAAMGVAIECAQAFLPARLFSPADMGANTLGVALGWLVAPPRIPDVLTHLERHVAAWNRESRRAGR